MESQLELEEAEDFQPACGSPCGPSSQGPHPGHHHHLRGPLFPLGSAPGSGPTQAPTSLWPGASQGPIKVPVEAVPPGLSEPLFPRWLYGVAGPEGRQRGFSMFGGCLSAK